MSHVPTASGVTSSFGWTLWRRAGAFVFFGVLALAACSVTSMAADDSPQGDGAPLRLALAMTAPLPQSVVPRAGRTWVLPVVGRACRQCRRICDHDYRKGCYEDWCRKQFTLCMRHCWYEYCR